MVKTKLHVPDRKHLYFFTFNILNKLSDEVGLDIDIVCLEMGSTIEDNGVIYRTPGKYTNAIFDPKTNETLFCSENPLKLYDFLNGYKLGLSKN